MAILHVDRRRRPLLRLALLAGAVAAFGAGLWLASALFDEAPPRRAEISGVKARRCCGLHTGAPGRQSETPFDLAADVAPTPPAVSLSDPAHAAQLYRQALLYLDCQVQAESSADFTWAAPEQSYQFDPSGALAAGLERDARARREPCRLLGPSEYGRIGSLMQRAAQLGDRDALFFMLNRRVQAAVDRAATERERGQPANDGELSALWKEAQALAAGGHRDAMVLVGQLLAAGHVGQPEPVRAAAWNLVALQLDRSEPLSESDVAESGLLSSLNDEESTQALQDAELLRRACCRR